MLLGLLFFATGPLWFGGSRFPAVPLLNDLWVAPAIQRLISMAVIACLVTLILFAQREHLRTALALILVGLIVGLVLLNQHRLQPWLLHLTLLIVVLSFKPSKTSHRTIRWMTVGIYFHSAISKLDYDFLTEGGFYLVRALGSVLQQTPDTWPRWLQLTSIAALPTFELIVAILLMSRLQRVGWRLAIVMHIGLLVALVTLNHKPAVLLWNIGFVLQAVYFLGTNVASSQLQTKLTGKALRTVHRYAVTAVCCLPFLNYEPIHIWDNWPSWALYSTRSERIGVFVLNNATQRLPLSIQQFVGGPGPIFRRVKIDRWSLEETGAPVYPEDRFWVAVALQLTTDMPPEKDTHTEPIHLQIESPSNRFTGKRKTVRLAGRKQLLDYATRFWLNAAPTASNIDGDPARAR